MESCSLGESGAALGAGCCAAAPCRADGSCAAAAGGEEDFGALSGVWLKVEEEAKARNAVSRQTAAALTWQVRHETFAVVLLQPITVKAL